jgi:hypothetical protein
LQQRPRCGCHAQQQANGEVDFQFTKISNSGGVVPASVALGASANDWACTYDDVTGLMWEVKTTSGLRSSQHNYSGYSSDASNNGGAVGTANNGVNCFDTVNCDTDRRLHLGASTEFVRTTTLRVRLVRAGL